MDPTTTAALISAGSQASGGLFGLIGAKKQHKRNIELADKARDHDVKMWNLQNEYNTPEMQMQRFKEAGLNPNLIYGQGNPGNASQPQKAPVTETGNEFAALSQMSMLPVLSMYQDWRVKNAQIDNLKAQAEATTQNATLTALRQITQQYTNKKLNIELPFHEGMTSSKSQLLQGQSELTRQRARILSDTYPQQIQNAILRNSLLQEQTRGHSLENDLNEELKPFGGSTNDNLIQRVFIRLFAPLIDSVNKEFKNPSFINKRK